MQKNVSGQKLIVFAFDSATGLPKSGDAANITAYRAIDGGSVTVLGDTSATEMDATNAKGFYLFDLTQAETNGSIILYSGKSSTSGIVVVGRIETTVPANFAVRVISSTGIGDANEMAIGNLFYIAGIATSGGNSTITLANTVTASQCLPGDWIVIPSGTGANQIGIVDSFDSATFIATLGPTTGTVPWAWPIANPTNGTPYTIVKMAGGRPASLADIFSNTEVPSRTLTSALNVTSTGTTVPITVAGVVQTDAASLIGTPVTTVSGDIANVKVDTGAIRVTTNRIIFSAVGNINANVKEVKDSGSLSGNGSILTPWGPP